MTTYDVVVAGAGPAGAAAACLLARAGLAVALLDPRLRAGAAPTKPGEALPGAVDRLLRAHALPRPADSRAHRPIGGNISAWGEPEATHRDFLAEPDGPGWRVDRRVFEADLVAAARAAGAGLRAGAVLDVVRAGAGWQVTTDDGETSAARWLVDATGRAARLARSLGARRHHDEGLVAVVGEGAPDAALRLSRTLVETTPEGWWYAALLPGGAPIFMLHTRPAHAARLMRDPCAWRAALAATRHVAAAFPGALVDGPLRSFDARGGRLDPVWGAGWAACGDAALCFDPAAAQGMFSALHGGCELAAAVVAALRGELGPLRTYGERLAEIRRIYRSRVRAHYAAERRWSDAPFWRDHQAHGP